MKVLYVINLYQNKYIDFHAVQIKDETEEDYITIDKINVENYKYNFPKNKLNFEFNMAYVTNELDKKTLKQQIDRIYNKSKELHYNEVNIDTQYEIYYELALDYLDKCVTPEKYEELKLDEKNKKEMLKKVEVFLM